MRAVYRICGRQTLLPRSLVIPLCYDPGEDPLFHGGFANVWKGRYKDEDVAAKVVKVYTKDDPKKTRSVGSWWCS